MKNLFWLALLCIGCSSEQPTFNFEDCSKGENIFEIQKGTVVEVSAMNFREVSEKVRRLVGDSIFLMQEKDISRVWFNLEDEDPYENSPVSKGREIAFSTELEGTGVWDDKNLEAVISFRCFELIPNILGEKVLIDEQTKFRYGGYFICGMAVYNELNKNVGYDEVKIRTQILVDEPYLKK